MDSSPPDNDAIPSSIWDELVRDREVEGVIERMQREGTDEMKTVNYEFTLSPSPTIFLLTAEKQSLSWLQFVSSRGRGEIE